MLSKLWFSPMITTTCLIGVVVGAAWLVRGVLPAAAAVIMTVTATAAPVTTAGWMSLLVMRTPFPSPWAGDLAPRRPACGGAAYPPKRDESANRHTSHQVNSWEREKECWPTLLGVIVNEASAMPLM